MELIISQQSRNSPHSLIMFLAIHGIFESCFMNLFQLIDIRRSNNHISSLQNLYQIQTLQDISKRSIFSIQELRTARQGIEPYSALSIKQKNSDDPSSPIQEYEMSAK